MESPKDGVFRLEEKKSSEKFDSDRKAKKSMEKIDFGQKTKKPNEKRSLFERDLSAELSSFSFESSTEDKKRKREKSGIEKDKISKTMGKYSDGFEEGLKNSENENFVKINDNLGKKRKNSGFHKLN